MRHSPTFRALQKLLCPLYPSQRLSRAPPSSLQSLPHRDSQSRTCLAVLKLPLGNLTPYRKPEMPGTRARASRGAHLLTRANANGARSTRHVLHVGGHLAFILAAPSSVSRISCGSLIGDLLHGNQSLPDVSTAERVPLLFYSFLQYKTSTHHPLHLHLGDYTLQLSYLQQHTSAQRDFIPLFSQRRDLFCFTLVFT